MMVGTWAATEFSRMAGVLDAWPAMDAVMAVIVAMSYRSRKERWKLELLATYVLQSTLHVGFAIADDGSAAAFNVYASSVNALFVMQLIIVAREGGRVMWDDVRNRLSNRMHRSDHVRSRAFYPHARRKEGVGDEDVHA